MRLQTDSDQDTVLMAAVAAVPDPEVILTLLKCGANPGASSITDPMCLLLC